MAFLIASCYNGTEKKLIIISIDSLDPSVLYLDSRGNPSGREGDWLMPNVRAFLKGGAWFEHARDYLPSATDMNHLNAVAGTSSGQTGNIMITQQLFDWNSDGTPNNVLTSLDWVRDDRGRPVDTLFKAWKRAYPGSTTLFASGKEWIANMFDAADSGIDLFLAGTRFPDYVSPPVKWSFYDPPGDPDALTDIESIYQWGFCSFVYETNPDSYPSDNWIVDSSLAMLDRENPDMSMIIMAQMDDLQHGLGSARNPDDFAGSTGGGISKSNAMVYREPILDGMKDVDVQFGRLIAGIRSMPEYRDAVIVLYSDHGHVTHNYTMASNVVFNTNVNEILHDAGVISDEEFSGVNFTTGTATSMGQVYFNRATLAERQLIAGHAKEVLEAHRVLNPVTGRQECPWYVLDITNMKNGIPGVCKPGELYNPYFAGNNDPGAMHWPDLMLYMKNGWQLPVLSSIANNIGTQLPPWLPPLNLFLGGHGSVDTAPIVIAVQGPGVKAGRVLADPAYAKDYRIADIAVTLANLFGLELKSTTVGRDRSVELR